MRVFLFHGSIFVDFQNSVICQRATFENGLQFHRSIRCKQTNAVQQPKVHFAHALFERKSWYQCYFTYCYKRADRSRKLSCNLLSQAIDNNLDENISYHIVNFLRWYWLNDLPIGYLHNRANSIRVAGSKILG